MQTFYEWLMEQTQRRDNVGDLARDAQRDPQLRSAVYTEKEDRTKDAKTNRDNGV